MTTTNANGAAQDTTNAASVENKIYPEGAKPNAEAAKPADAPASNEAPKDEVKQPEGEKPKDGGQAAHAEFKLVLPKDSLLDAARVEAVTSFAKEKGLNPEQAQAILNQESALLADHIQNQQKQYDAQLQKWTSEIQSDPELGGANFKESAHLAKQVAEKFGTPELLKQLQVTGLGNHPELVRVFARIGKAMDNDKLIRPGSSSEGSKKSHADVLYPNAR